MSTPLPLLNLPHSDLTVPAPHLMVGRDFFIKVAYI